MADQPIFVDVMKAIQMLKHNGNFQLYIRYLDEMLESNRLQLEESDNNFRQLQGRVSCLRELIGTIANADHLALLAGQSGEPTPEPR